MRIEQLIDMAGELTPVELVNGLYFKREDKFQPLGVGGINGSKLRQLIWLFATKRNAKGVLAGAVSNSPQHLMVSAVAKLFDMPCSLITGAKDLDKFPMLRLAKNYGAEFEFSKVGYAQTLQAKAFALQKEEKYKDYFVVETNITMSEKLNSTDEIRSFHSIGAMQVQNIPEDVTTLVLPCGSCNSAVSVLYGIWKYGKKHIDEIYLMGIGSYGSKDINYIYKRLGSFAPEALTMFSEIDRPEVGKTKMIHFNLNGEGYCKYEDMMPYSWEDIEFHPRYEGKIMNYISEKGMLGYMMYKKALFWIVGSAPTF